jgi:hypothetical protein
MTIAGVDVGAETLPEVDDLKYQVSIGQASDGSFKRASVGDSYRNLQIILSHKTTTVKDALYAALEADADGVIVIAPDSHIDKGAGTGVSVTGLWLDTQRNATKTKHDAWDIVLNFARVS